MLIKQFEGFAVDENGRVVLDTPAQQGVFETTIGARHGVRMPISQITAGQWFVGPDNHTVYELIRFEGHVARVRNVVKSHVWNPSLGGFWEDEGWFAPANLELMFVHRIGKNPD